MILRVGTVGLLFVLAASAAAEPRILTEAGSIVLSSEQGVFARRNDSGGSRTVDLFDVVTPAELAAATASVQESVEETVSISQASATTAFDAHKSATIAARDITIVTQNSTMAQMSTAIIAQASAATAFDAHLSASIAAQNSTILGQDSTIVAQNSMMAQMSTAIVSLQGTVVAMQARVVALEPASTAAPTPRPTAAPVCSGTCCGTVDENVAIGSDAMLAQLAPAVSRACTIRHLYISNIGNLTLLAEAFKDLRTLTGRLDVVVTHLTTLDGIFPALTSVGSTFTVGSNSELVTLGSGFAALERVGGQLQINANSALTTIGTSFGRIQSVGSVFWYGNGGQTSSNGGASSDGSTAGSRSFCASAVAVLCPTSTSYPNPGWADSAHDCCNTYCATTTDC